MPNLLGWVNDKIVRLDKFHPNLLHYIFEIIDQSWETLVVFDQNFEVWNVKNGTKNEIPMTHREKLQLEDTYILHNHPVPGTFSPDDITNIAGYNIARAFVTNPDGSVYILDRPSRGWPNELKDFSSEPMKDLWFLAAQNDLEGYEMQLEYIAYQYAVEYWQVKIR